MYTDPCQHSLFETQDSQCTNTITVNYNRYTVLIVTIEMTAHTRARECAGADTLAELHKQKTRI